MRNKATKHGGIVLAVVFMTALFAGCGFIGSAGVDEDLIPKTYLVKTDSSFYTTNQIVFTGNPAADFTAARLYANDPTNDVYVYSSGDPNPASNLSNVADFRNIYIAYSQLGLYIGVKMDVPDLDTISPYKMAFYVLIDNNVTVGAGNGGLTNFTAASINYAGLSGDFGFDNAGASVYAAAGGKISFYLKHWREAGGAQWKPFYFWNGTGNVANRVPFGSGFEGQLLVYPPNNTKADVTEVFIPWYYIFGTALGAPNTALPSSELKLWFGTTPTLGEDGFVDTYPANVGPEGEWLHITQASEWAILTITD